GMGMGAGFTAGGLLPGESLKAIARVAGVSGVQAQVMLPLNPSTSQFMTLTQELILGMDLTVPTPNKYFPQLPVREGRNLRAGDQRLVVLGASFAVSHGLHVGDHLPLEGESFEVVGILQRTLTAPDRFVTMAIE